MWDYKEAYCGSWFDNLKHYSRNKLISNSTTDVPGDLLLKAYHKEKGYLPIIKPKDNCGEKHVFD